jgi:hypothetical protein
MDTQSNIQKRKRVLTNETPLTILGAKEADEMIVVVDTSRYGLPSNEEDDPSDEDVDQGDNEKLEESTLFWTNQRTIQAGKDDELTLGNSSVEHQLQRLPNLPGKLFT